MENYSIYDEIGRGTHSFVYKARRKRSIEFVAVKSTDKCRMDKILNEVQLLHKLDSSYVLKFYNWYESQNHIWLILEYCIGGDLLNLITQDKQLPEPAVQLFGSELVAGLQYLHSSGILFCDLKPASILIDEFGSLKLADFGLARRIPSHATLTTAPHLAPGSPNYMAPELFQQPAVHSFASDFWALGCVLYELCVGHQPFTHTNFSELARMIQTTALELPVAGCAMGPPFWALLTRLLEKDPYKRITWDELVDHPFWAGLPQLPKVAMPKQELFDAASRTSQRAHDAARSRDCAVDNAALRHRDTHASVASDALSSQHSSAPTELIDRASRGSSSTTDAAEEDDEDDDDDDDGNEDDDEDDDGSSSDAFDDGDEHTTDLLLLDGASAARLRPVSAPVQPSVFANRDASKQRARAAVDRRQQQPRDSPHASTNSRSKINSGTAEPTVPRTAPAQAVPSSSTRTTVNDRRAVPADRVANSRTRDTLKKPSKLIFTASDCAVKPIVCSDEIESVVVAPVHAASLRFAPLAAEQLLACSTEELESHLKDVYVSLKASAGAARCDVLAHLYTLCRHAKLANVIVNSSILALLARLLASLTADTAPANSFDSDAVVAMLCLDLGVLFRFATFIAPSSPEQLESLVATLVHATRRARTQLPRRRAAACLGELLFYVSTQPDWRFPVAGLDCAVELLETDDVVLRHYAARTLCNVLVHCVDALRATLLTERVAQPLADGLVQLCDDDDNSDDGGSGSENERRQRLAATALRTTTTQAIAQLLRHLRVPPASAKTAASSHERTATLLLLTAPPVLLALWRGAMQWQTSAELATASFNALNAALDARCAPRSGRTSTSSSAAAAQTALDANRAALFASSAVSFAPLAAMLATPRAQYQDAEVTADTLAGASHCQRERRYSHDASRASSLLRAKMLLFTHLAVLASRRFALECIAQRYVALVDRVLHPFAAHLRASSDVDGVGGSENATTDEVTIATASPTSSHSSRRRALSPSDALVLQCALHVVRSAIRLALQLSAECLAAHDSDDALEDRARSRATVSAAPFALLRALLRPALCRAQLVTYFVATDPRAFAFFVRLMAKLLVAVPTESLCVASTVSTAGSKLENDDDDDDSDLTDSRTTVAMCVSEILLRLLHARPQDVTTLLAAEHELLFTQLLPTVALQLHGGSNSASRAVGTNIAAAHARSSRDGSDDDLHANCLRVLYAALLTGDSNSNDDTNDLDAAQRDAFVRDHVLSAVHAVLTASDPNESVTQFAVELLDGLVARDAALLPALNTAKLVAPVVALLRAPQRLGWDALPASTTRLVKCVVDAATLRADALDALFVDCALADALTDGLAFAAAGPHAAALSDLLDALYALLLSRYDALRRAKAARTSPPAAPVRFDALVHCVSVVLSLCAPQSRSHHSQQKQSPQPHESPVKTKWRNDQNGQQQQQLNDDRDDSNGSDDADVPELASRCLVYLSQIFGDKLNGVVFARAAKQPRGSDDPVARAMLAALEQNASDGVVVLRLLLTLKNCIRCQSTSSSSSTSSTGSAVRVTRWLLEHSMLHQRVKRLAATNRGASKSAQETASPSSMTREQVAKTASDILRLCVASPST